MSRQKKENSSKNSGKKTQVVLVADNDPYSLSCISILLGRFGYEVLKAKTGSEVFDSAARLLPCLVVAALDLPDVDSLELMNRLNKDPATRHIPVIALLSENNQSMTDRCLENGAVGCLCRPVDVEVLYRIVQAEIEKKPRSCMRVRTVQPVKVYGKAQESLYGAYTLALSEGGMFLRTMNPVSVDSELSLELSLDDRTITADAVVLYNCQAGCGPNLETGIGLRFIDITPGDRNLLRQFIRNDLMKGITLTEN